MHLIIALRHGSLSKYSFGENQAPTYPLEDLPIPSTCLKRAERLGYVITRDAHKSDTVRQLCNAGHPQSKRTTMENQKIKKAKLLDYKERGYEVRESFFGDTGFCLLAFSIA